MEQETQEARLSPLGGTRLLIVEDEFLVLLDLQTVLLEAGAAAVVPVRTGAGVAALEEGRFDAAILDVRLGRNSVSPVAQLLSESGTPFLFYTGEVREEPTLRTWSTRMVLAKPAMADTIVAAVASLLGR